MAAAIKAKRKPRRGGIGNALGLSNARLGMTIIGSWDPEGEEGPEPGTYAFGQRAKRRRRRLLGKRNWQIQPRDPSKTDTDLKA